ncbi:unnamed protein product [Closterium sp. Yama58-4]|nr:unnamed protein product [Closterium sp. Yama58-4]
MAAEAAQSGVELPAALAAAVGSSAESALAPASHLVPSAQPPTPALAHSADVGGVAKPLSLHTDHLQPPASLPVAVATSALPSVAQPSPVAQPPQAAVTVSAQVTTVGAGSDPARVLPPEPSPPQQAAPPSAPNDQRAGSETRAAAGGHATSHRGRGSPRRRPSPSYRTAHRGGRGGWRGGPGRGQGGATEVQQMRTDLPWMFAAAMRSAQFGSSSHIGSQLPHGAAPAPAPDAEQAHVPLAPPPAAPPAVVPVGA